MNDNSTTDVSDTALWVAVFRARESSRPDALFADPFAARLAGERGFALATDTAGSPQTSWSVAIRTVIIDELVREAVASGVDAVLCLGAGLDARPYRLTLPSELRWIEVDFPHVIAMKNQLLADDSPHCRIERVGLDLSQREARRALLKRLAAESSNIIVLTEGVVPYLSVDEVASLAEDLHAHSVITRWIIDYFAPDLVRALQTRAPTPGNALLRFAPDDWLSFFAEHGWRSQKLRYLFEASERLGRDIPYPPAIRELLAYTQLERV